MQLYTKGVIMPEAKLSYFITTPNLLRQRKPHLGTAYCTPSPGSFLDALPATTSSSYRYGRAWRERRSAAAGRGSSPQAWRDSVFLSCGDL